MDIVENSKKTELLRYTEVEGTPFTIARVELENKDEYEYTVLMGKYRIIEEPYKKKKMR